MFQLSGYVGELWQITTFDGLTYQMTDYNTRAVLTTPGELGLPPINYATRKPYKQPGEVLLNYDLEVRDFSILMSQRGCSREEYWQARQDLIQVTRPNRGGVITLTIIMADNTRRAIRAVCVTPTFPATSVDEWREWGFTEEIQLKALDPVWFNPTSTELELTQGQLSELAFPITFDDDNIYFDDAGFFGRATITYTGTWYSWPIITITGPFDTAFIFHENLNLFIQYLQPLAAGSTLVIDLSRVATVANEQPNVKVTVNGIDRYGFLAPNSDIADFRIEVDPLVAGGINQIGFNLPGFSIPDTSVSITYPTRYIGI